MTSTDLRTRLYLKKFLTQQQMSENFLDYLLKQTRDVLETSWPSQGVFYGGALSADGPDAFQVSTPLRSTDGSGRLLELAVAESTGIMFENQNTIPYHVGLRFNEIPNGTEVNVRTGVIEYSKLEERIGELGQPNAVVDNGTTLTLTVDAVAEVGVTNAGRQVLVWLKTAAGQADAFYEGTVYFSGGVNKVDTINLLGQATGAASTTPADYYVFLIGPTVRRNTDLSLDPAVVYLGKVTGAGAGSPPVTFTDGRTTLFSDVTVPTIHDELKSFITGGGLITWDLATQTLTWADPVVFRRPNRPTNFSVAADSETLADGEILYIDASGAGGTVPQIKVAANSMPNVATNWPLAMRVGNNVYFRDGSLELKGDASSSTSGRISDITQDLLTFLGATDESDSDPNYPSTVTANTVVTQGDPLTAAISDLNQVVTDLLINQTDNDLTGAKLGETFDTILARLSRSADLPARLWAALIPDTKIRLAATLVMAPDGSGRTVSPIDGLVNTAFVATSVDLTSGIVTGGTVLSEGGVFTIPASTPLMFRRLVFMQKNDGTVDSKFSTEAASVAVLTDAGTILAALSGRPIGYIDLEAYGANAFKTAGSATNVVEGAVGGAFRIINFSGSSTPPTNTREEFTKFVDTGAYTLLSTALAAAVAGDSILVMIDHSEVADIQIPADVRVQWRPGKKTVFTGNFISGGLRLTGARAQAIEANLRFDTSGGGVATGIAVEAADCKVSAYLDWNTSDALGKGVYRSAAGLRSRIEAVVKVTLGTVTTLFDDDSGGAGVVNVIGG